MFLIQSVSADAIFQSIFNYGFSEIWDTLMVLIGSLAIFILIIVMQYAGIDVIGLTFNIVTYTIDTFFIIFARVSSKEENLVGAVFVFIFIMALIMDLLI